MGKYDAGQKTQGQYPAACGCADGPISGQGEDGGDQDTGTQGEKRNKDTGFGRRRIAVALRGDRSLGKLSLGFLKNKTGLGCLLSGIKSNRFTMECQVKKTGGNEGFFLYWGLTEPQGKGYVYNVGGWGNQTTAVEEVNQGRTSGVAGDNRTAQSLETERWYQVKMVVTPQKSCRPGSPT